jgi:predicted AAA+ superfamily ATPase
VAVMIVDRDLTPRLRKAARQFPAVTVTGPRQSGKSTLCRAVFPKLPYVSLEAPDVRAFALDDPRAFLARFPRGAVIDEVQRAPDLPSYLQGVIDTDPKPGRWILTGSQNLALLESVSQSLAGRAAVLHLLPLARSEVIRFRHPPKTLDETLIAGGYPRIFDRRLDPSDWLGSYVATYIERDVRTISNVGDLVTFQRFVELCAGRTGQLLNYSSLAADCGISQPSAKAWLSILEASFLAFRLPPFRSNLRKRLVKMPRLHFYDSGLVCWLLGIRTPEQLRLHPLRGAIFESWVVSEIAKHRVNGGETGGLSFYRDRDAVEADLVIEYADRLRLVEAKSAQTASASLFDGANRVRRLLEDPLRRCEVVIAYGGDESQRRSSAKLVPWSQLHEEKWR